MRRRNDKPIPIGFNISYPIMYPYLMHAVAGVGFVIIALIIPHES
jgi:hypothetical protein